MSNAPPFEVEIKLRSTEAGMAALKASPLWQERGNGGLQTTTLRSRYFDTPDHRLGAQGLGLRVREDDGRLVQTLKAEAQGQAAAKARAEWEVELTEALPDLRAFRDEQLLGEIGLILPEDLAPIFETRIERTAALIEWPVASGGVARIEVAFDDGVVAFGERSQPIRELELELKSGPLAGLYELLGHLRTLAPLSVETLSKADRGLALIGRRRPGARKAPPIRFTLATTVEEALSTVLRSALGHLLDNEAPAIEGRDPEGVHQMRVALRRLRSALSIFRPVLKVEDRERWNDGFRWLLARLGPARDLDVFLEELLVPIVLEEGGTVPLACLHELAEDARARAYRRMRTTLKGDHYSDLVLDFAAWVELQGWRQGASVEQQALLAEPLYTFATATLEKRHRALRRGGRNFAELGAEARHEVRKTLKKLRYGVDFFGSLYDPERVRPFARSLAAFQDELGHLNDVAVAATLVGQLVAGAKPDSPGSGRDGAIGAGIVIGWYGAASAAHLKDAIANWRAFRHATPFWREGEA